MDEFVCVRLVQGWGLDLTLFQFDYWSTWMVFLMNGDREIYGRFSWRGTKDIEALRKAFEGALELHKKYPANKDELVGKKGLPFPWKTTQEIPTLKAKGKYADGKKGCVHCHNVLEEMRKSYRTRGEAAPARLTEPYPVPERTGLTLMSSERATVSHVQRGSAAETAGFKPGDRLMRLAGQPLISIADVEWVLFRAEDPDTLKAQVEREGQSVDLELPLPRGWRTKD